MPNSPGNVLPSEQYSSTVSIFWQKYDNKFKLSLSEKSNTLSYLIFFLDLRHKVYLDLRLLTIISSLMTSVHFNF